MAELVFDPPNEQRSLYLWNCAPVTGDRVFVRTFREGESLRVDWGDGAVDDKSPYIDEDMTMSHVYRDSGLHTLRVKATTCCAGSGGSRQDEAVLNVRPAAIGPPAAPEARPCDGLASLGPSNDNWAGYSDGVARSGGAAVTAEIPYCRFSHGYERSLILRTGVYDGDFVVDWGDGTSPKRADISHGQTSTPDGDPCTHVYATAGTYRVHITVTDTGSSSTAELALTYVAT